MSQSKNLLTMFKQQGAGDIGLDQQTTDMVIANLNANTLPMCVGAPVDEFESDDVTIIFFALDGSPSMSPVEDVLIDEFNNTIIPALKGVNRKTAQTIVVGGLVFDDKVRPLWNGGFLKLDDIPTLTKKNYNTDSGWGTALHKAQIDALSAVSVYTSTVIGEAGITPKTIVVTLSDGANNQPPSSPNAVYQITSKLSNEIFVLSFVGFETGERVDFRSIAQATGFSTVWDIKARANESVDEKRRKFRRMLGVLSSSLVRQSQTQIDPSKSGGFFSS